MTQPYDPNRSGPNAPQSTYEPSFNPPPAPGTSYSQQAFNAAPYGQPAYGQPNYPVAPPPPGTDAAGRVYDAQSGLYLPAGVQLASVGRRIGAWFLSCVLVLVTLVIGYLIWGLVLWSRGTTPALKVLGMKCYRTDDGTVPTWGRMFLRDFLGRLVTGVIPFGNLISLIMFASGQRRQALYDKIASTTVVYDPNNVLG